MPRYVPAWTFALGIATVSASPFVDLRAVNLVDVVMGIWRRHTVPRVPDEAPAAVAAGAPPAGWDRGAWVLDFTWNDTVAWVWVDPTLPASVAPFPASQRDAVLGVAHAAAAQPGVRGPLLGVNVTVEACQALPEGGAQWVRESESAQQTDNFTLHGMYAGFLHIPARPMWDWLRQCSTAFCAGGLEHGAPVALRAAVEARGGDASAMEALAREILARAAPGTSRAPFAAAALALGRDGAVAVGDVGWEAGWRGAPLGAAASALERGVHKPPTAAAAAEAHAAALPHMEVPAARELLIELPRAAYRWAMGLSDGGAALGGAPAYECNPGSVRVTATEWSLPRSRFRLLARLALVKGARFARIASPPTPHPPTHPPTRNFY
jgi:hypothetical protein